MKVDIWSDIRCPFCYVGKKNFEKALDQFPEKENIEVTWHSFQLDPDMKTQPEKNSLEYFSERKGVSAEQAKGMYEHVYKAGKDAGIEFNFDHQKVANSYRGHLLLQLAASKNLANEAEEALFKAQLIEGKNIDDEATLIEIGKSISLNEEDIKNALVSDEFAAQVSKDMMLAQQMRISGVPFFVINDKYGVSGAQPSPVFSEVLEKSWEEFSAGDQGLKIIHSGESCDVDGNCD
ncbi:DsbA family oxidoreductase [Kaistella jeonii]|uniref:DSBA oxidoreductase n=1 Tax=Kaistella jeonii TaxID=266749 RepID=A0A0C1D2D6_9FLAO|nr:DsbA family oxidoreductase [Kaistella jeonii]KIA87945.1 DSBA oxidoreductase [Kaistella jeonii]SFC33606.1 Predicted dithiol-disulfide isomerase, DsbA family [Kaistella jeonii]VEI95519.1 Protein-disulfide isomerase [Kaistella jeonii]